MAHIIALLWLPQANVLRSQPDNVASAVNDASTGTPSTHINANIVIHVRIELIVAKMSPSQLRLRLRTGRRTDQYSFAGIVA